MANDGNMPIFSKHDKKGFEHLCMYRPRNKWGASVSF